MARSTLRLNNWNYLGGQILMRVLVPLGFGIAAVIAFFSKIELTPEEVAKGHGRIWAALIAVGCLSTAGTFGYLVFRRYALWMDFGDKFRFRMLYGSGTRKWSDVKNVKLLWEHDQDERRSYLQVEVILKGGKKLWVCVSEKQAAKFELFAQSRLPELGVQFIDKT